MNFVAIETRSGEAARLLKLMANPHRLRVLCELTQGERSVGALAERIGLSQSALSQHLSRLRSAGLVRTRRENQTVFYASGSTRVTAIMEALCAIYDNGEATDSSGETADVH